MDGLTFDLRALAWTCSFDLGGGVFSFSPSFCFPLQPVQLYAISGTPEGTMFLVSTRTYSRLRVFVGVWGDVICARLLEFPREVGSKVGSAPAVASYGRDYNFRLRS